MTTEKLKSCVSSVNNWVRRFFEREMASEEIKAEDAACPFPSQDCGEFYKWHEYCGTIQHKREAQLLVECFFHAKPWIRKKMFAIIVEHNCASDKLSKHIRESVEALQLCNSVVLKNKRVKTINERCYEVCRSLMRVHFPEGLAVDLLNDWKEYEQSLWKVTPYYRDHFLHSLYDYSIGLRFLDKFRSDFEHNWSVLSKPYPGDKVVSKSFKRTWLLAALFHDIGYPAEKLRDFSNFARKQFFDKVPGMTLSDIKLLKTDIIKDDIDELLTMMAFVLTDDEYSFSFAAYKRFVEDKTYPNKLIFNSIRALFADQLSKLDHGVMGALLVMLTLKIDIHELTFTNDIVNPRKLKMEREDVLEDVITASLAIAMHNVRTSAYPGLTIDYRTHPIAFMLSLCDELHEWERMVRDGYVYKNNDDVIVDVDLPMVYFTTEIKWKMSDKRDMISIDTPDAKGISIMKLINYERRDKIHATKQNDLDNTESFLADLQAVYDKQIGPLKDGANKIIVMTVRILDVEEYGRLSRWWNSLNKLFSKNLSYGPSILILCQTREGNIPFFAAFYSHDLKEYKVIEAFKVGKRDSDR